MNAGPTSLALSGVVVSAIFLGVIVPNVLSQTNEARVEVIDGDTFKLGKETIRLWGIDAPELSQTCLSAQFTRYKCGRDAERLLSAILQTEKPDCFRLGRDHHGRTIAKCQLLNEDIGAFLVRSGFALDMPQYSGGIYAKDEEQARAAKRGLHSGPFLPPEEYRRNKELRR